MHTRKAGSRVAAASPEPGLRQARPASSAPAARDRAPCQARHSTERSGRPRRQNGRGSYPRAPVPGRHQQERTSPAPSPRRVTLTALTLDHASRCSGRNARRWPGHGAARGLAPSTHWPLDRGFPLAWDLRGHPGREGGVRDHPHLDEEQVEIPRLQVPQSGL